MKKEDLDKRICDVEPNETCTMTYREYIDWGYTELGYPKKKDINKLYRNIYGLL